MTSASEVSLQDIQPWREAYRLEMACQIIHDSIHGRPGWTREFRLALGGTPVGYGSLAVGGPWRERHTLYEFYVQPPYRLRVFDLFEALLAGCGAVAIETQSNDALLTHMLHAYAVDVASESILYHDRVTTAHPPPAGVVSRAVTAEDDARMPEEGKGADWLLEVDGVIAATGGLLWHYNRPYGDIHMQVAEAYRRRGLGAYLVQELKRVCYERGSVPACRCNVTNVGSRKTLQKAGFVPCGHILVGSPASP